MKKFLFALLFFVNTNNLFSMEEIKSFTEITNKIKQQCFYFDDHEKITFWVIGSQYYLQNEINYF